MNQHNFTKPNSSHSITSSSDAVNRVSANYRTEERYPLRVRVKVRMLHPSGAPDNRHIETTPKKPVQSRIRASREVQPEDATIAEMERDVVAFLAKCWLRNAPEE
ncbi:hypothetical protein GWI33_020012 [Rhynchophorus ferrugineus]|uniref:Uncharacterized protein n=1 Tax=Rhynchophorus ferrugineus TaxID=354439 RepID=A0A834HX61_RHYFE|nr:hypothetical protein GWI33_020012 [Rhynchophorus ferrugineus]